MENLNIVVPASFGVLVSAIVYYADELGNKRNFDWRMIAALVGSVGTAVLLRFDVFGEFTAAVPYVGYVLTGIVVSRVANFVDDGIKRVKG